MDQDADSVWVMTLNCLDHNNAYVSELWTPTLKTESEIISAL